MKIKKIWMSPDTAKKSHYRLRKAGGIAVIVIIMLILNLLGALLPFFTEWFRKICATVVCFGSTAIACWMALRVGWRSVRDATVFILTEKGNMYIVDAARMSYGGKGFYRYMADLGRTQDLLRTMAESPFLPDCADEILKVEKIRENSSYFSIVCQVRHSDGSTGRVTYFLVKGYEDQELLLNQLEMRKTSVKEQDVSGKRNRIGIFISATACVGFTVLCVASHPAVEWLPQNVYFPCLGAVMISFFFVVYFILCIRRGN